MGAAGDCLSKECRHLPVGARSMLYFRGCDVMCNRMREGGGFVVMVNMLAEDGEGCVVVLVNKKGEGNVVVLMSKEEGSSTVVLVSKAEEGSVVVLRTKRTVVWSCW